MIIAGVIVGYIVGWAITAIALDRYGATTGTEDSVTMAMLWPGFVPLVPPFVIGWLIMKLVERVNGHGCDATDDGPGKDEF